MPDDCENHSKAFACLILHCQRRIIFIDYVNKPVACINAIFIRFVVSYYGLQKEVIGSGLENTFKNQEKEHSGHDENNFFFYSIFYFIQQLFLNPLSFAFLNQFTASENLRVAGDSTGRRRILTTLIRMLKPWCFLLRKYFMT